MAKAIHWPEHFRDAIVAETPEQLCVAFRLGTLYAEGQYWQDGDVVDIRCNHLKVRRGVVVGDMTTVTVGQLTPEMLRYQKPGLQSKEAIIDFFEAHYQTHVSDDTMLSVVYYRNAPLDETYMDLALDASGRQF